jgi:hypothetical protein
MFAELERVVYCLDDRVLLWIKYRNRGGSHAAPKDAAKNQSTREAPNPHYARGLAGVAQAVDQA